jgi:DNA-binding response OmpR family regulator
MADKLKLLLMDDEDSLRILVRDELESGGFEVVEANSGEMALEVLQGAHFDLAILDIRMPGIDGLEVLKRIRKENQSTKVIMLTGVDELKIARDSLALGANDFLTKPYDFKTLNSCIQRVLTE